MFGSPRTEPQYTYQEGVLMLSSLIIQLIIINYLVHPSYKSETAIRITRRPITNHQNQQPKMQPENPYVFKPKSYSKKRNVRESLTSSYIAPLPNKKIKVNTPHSPNLNNQNLFDQKTILSLLHCQKQDFFINQQDNYQKIEEQITPFSLPLKLRSQPKSKKNPLLSHDIEIVTTNNQKHWISIHQDLLKAHTNHSKQEQSLEGIVNPFNAKLKTYFSDNIQFIRDYKSGYTPIELQNKSKKQEENKEKEGALEQNKKEKAGSLKTHFIKKKQSTLSLARTCGVSYIKPSESTQNGPYDALPPLIFQCSTSCSYTSELRQLYHTHIEKLIQLSSSKCLPAIITNEDHMRDLLLGKPRGKVIWIEGLLSVWPLFNQGTFILVLFDTELAVTEDQVWKQFNTCYFKFGILAKKSTSGKKLFLKSIQLQSAGDKDQTLSLNSFASVTETVKSEMQIQEPEKNKEPQPSKKIEEINESPVERNLEEKKLQQSPPEERKQCKDVCQQFMRELKNSRTVITMSLKFEMYVHEDFWKKSTNQSKNLMNAIIHSFEQNLQKKALEVIRDRLQLANKAQREQLIAKAIQKIRLGGDISKLEEAKPYVHFGETTLDLRTLINLNEKLQSRPSNIINKSPIAVNDVYRDRQGRENLNQWQKSLKMPIYYISTRDSFAFDLVQKITYLERQGRPYKRIDYYFERDNLPENFTQYKKIFPDLSVGVTCYHDFFSNEELRFFQDQTMQTELSAFKNKFLQMTVQPTIIGSRIKRTKFFFGYRYMWTRCQLAEPNSYVGAGVRRDVTPAPKWIKNIENPMIQHSILEPNFLNSVAINVYHDGTEGLAQHFDDAVRFRQPIYTLRLVSDGRLSFGSQFYGFCNGAFIIPLPRGCICIMKENSYAANGVKHCVRPCDMSGKSVAVILRQMHTQVVSEAAKYDELIDFPAWLSTLSDDPKAVTFAEQKRREAQKILADDETKKQKQKDKPKLAIDLY